MAYVLSSKATDPSQKGGCPMSVGTILSVLDASQSYYSQILMRGVDAGPEAARAYLSGRGLDADVCRRWGIGFAPGGGALSRALLSAGYDPADCVAADVMVCRDGAAFDRFSDRVTFPIRDAAGRTVGFGARLVPEAARRPDGLTCGKARGAAPKYLNTRETEAFDKSSLLFGLDTAKKAIAETGAVVVCEGYTDVIAMQEAGFWNTVAALGTALTPAHLSVLSRMGASKVCCMFDGDRAGRGAALRAARYLEDRGIAFSCVVLPGGMDPKEFLDSEGGWRPMRDMLKGAVPLASYVIEATLARYDLSVPGQRARAFSDTSRILGSLRGSPSYIAYCCLTAQRFGMDRLEFMGRLAAPAPPLGRADPGR